MVYVFRGTDLGAGKALEQMRYSIDAVPFVQPAPSLTGF